MSSNKNNQNTVLEVTNLSKIYRLGVISTGMLFQDITSKIAVLRGKEDPNSRFDIASTSINGKQTHSKVLDNISFKVNKGEIIGIIGKNGAGKSTLLKIISRITTPSKGSIKIKGRVGCLLEVGTGFHPELTGRENIYLNGSILGLRRLEIKDQIEQIIEFSGISKYIDTPVKRYSSGMYVRLGFSVAAHMNPDILIVDEVLAVGDHEFRNKAIGKMKNISANKEKTILFVSHNMGAIRELCDRVILLKDGKVDIISDSNTVINHYLFKDIKEDKGSYLFPDVKKTRNIIFNNLCLMDSKRNLTNKFQINDHIKIILKYELFDNIKGLIISVAINYFGETIIKSYDSDLDDSILMMREKGKFISEINFPSNLFKIGKYTVTVGCFLTNTNEQIFIFENIIGFEIYTNEDVTFKSYGISPGHVICKIPWLTKKDIKV